MARKFRVDDVVRVKEEIRDDVCGTPRQGWLRHDWIGTVRDYETLGRELQYGVQPGKAVHWGWFAARDLDLISRPKPKKKGAKP